MTQKKRDCLFFVADKAMGDVVDGFLSRGQLEGRLGCRGFQFDFNYDLLEAPQFGMGADGGIYKHCHSLLREYKYTDTHERVVAMLDQQFGGELPAADVRQEILGRLETNGWDNDRAEVIVIDPELEVWVWQDNPHVAGTVGHRAGRSFLRHAQK